MNTFSNLQILLSNDDGITSPGLYTLWKAFKELATLSIVAPSEERSATGMGVTLNHPLYMQTSSLFGNSQAWSLSGNPSDCVKLAIHEVYHGKNPDLILSGINLGRNTGRNVLYSGTAAVAIEGTLRGVPSIAFSYEDQKPLSDEVLPYLISITTHLIENPLPKGTFLNVNLPEYSRIKGIRYATQGSGYWMENIEKRHSPHGNPYYWMGGKVFSPQEHPESDIALFQEGFITLTPIQINNLTDTQEFTKRKAISLS